MPSFGFGDAQADRSLQETMGQFERRSGMTHFVVAFGELVAR